MTDATNAAPMDMPAAAPPPPTTHGYEAVVSGPMGEPRSPVTVILLSIITLGIYGIWWQYKTFKEMKDHSGMGMGGVLGLVFAIFVGIVNVFMMPSEVGNLYERSGQPKPVSGVTGFWVLLPLIGFIVWVVKTQGALNRYWRSMGAA